MLLYSLIGLSLVLLGVCGLQFMYMFYVERVFNERKNYLRTLEGKNRDLQDRLAAAERRVAEQSELLGSAHSNSSIEDEIWADVIWDR
jgi:hypothetical protein